MYMRAVSDAAGKRKAGPVATTKAQATVVMVYRRSQKPCCASSVGLSRAPTISKTRIV